MEVNWKSEVEDTFDFHCFMSHTTDETSLFLGMRGESSNRNVFDLA